MNVPVAITTLLGWTVCGPMRSSFEKEVSINFIRREYDLEIISQLQRLYDAEFNDRISNTQLGTSVENRKAKKIVDDSAKLVDGHYQIKLPSDAVFPKSRNVAERKLEWLKWTIFERNIEF